MCSVLVRVSVLEVPSLTTGHFAMTLQVTQAQTTELITEKKQTGCLCLDWNYLLLVKGQR